MNKENLLLIDKVVLVLKELEESLVKTTSIFKSNDYLADAFYLIRCLDGLKANTTSLRILVPELILNFEIEHSIGLLLRNSLHECINIFYLASIKITNKLVFDDSVKKLYADQIYSSVYYLRYMSSNNFIDKETIEIAFIEILKRYSFVFSDDKTKKIEERFIFDRKQILSIGAKVKIVTSVSQIKYFKEAIIKIYDLYHQYSKYEHSGAITHSLQRRTDDILINNIIGSLDLITFGIMHCLFLLKDHNFDLDNDIEELKSIRLKFDKL